MEKFYLGLDIGTNSVGIACTDENYNILRAKGKDLWAVRLFDEALPASERRMKRTMRRRLMRRRRRIELLQELLAPVMAERDDKFFIRLNNSPYFAEDKRGTDSKYVIFADDDYTDADFYRDYPTIYHLRSALIKGTAKKDIRLYYIAMHHILKYRGNFLFEGQELSAIRDINEIFKALNNAIMDLYDDAGECFDESKLEDFKREALEKRGVSYKSKKCLEIFGNVTARQKEMIKLIVGGTANTEKLFGEGDYEDIKSICFKKLEDAVFDAYAQTFSDEEFELLSRLRAVYNYITFENVLGGYEYISDAMVSIYDKHASDLAKLKKLLRADKQLYNEVFRDIIGSNDNYVAYVGYTKVRADKKSKCKRCVDPAVFYKYIKKLLETHRDELGDDAVVDEILEDIGSENFMPRQLNADNGVFPYQVNESELDAILRNAERDFPQFLEESDGCTLSHKIKSVLRFRIPYYVGPLNTYHEDNGGNSWMVRKAAGRITPWNFEEKVDKAASNEKFMRRMTNKCSFLHGKDVLPKCSVIYQKYDTLNQINKMRINDKPISVDVKQGIFNDLFLKYKRVTVKRIRDYLAEKGYISESEKKNTVIECGDGEIKVSMSTYVTLKNILGDIVDRNDRLCEDIVLWHTLNTDKNIVENLIIGKYGDIPEVQNNIKALKGLNFKDFGRLSEELLCEVSGGMNENTGEIYTILGELYKTNKNFNEILWSDEYTFRKNIDAENEGRGSDVTYEDVEELYVSPAVRRGIWQALIMCDEYTEALGRKPDKVFVEVTRTNDDKKKGERTKSRKEQLLGLYDNINSEDIGYLKERLSEETDFKLRQERLYLYYRQLGKCMYTGEQIDPGALMTDQYDIDHIIPRSLTKDDSLDNKVLVKSEINRFKKKDTYPVPDSCRPSKAVALWKLLKEKELISDTKYDRLIRTAELSQDELEEFINRQIVFTGQAVKAVAELLKRKYETDGREKVVCYSKASNVSDFRKTYGFVKCRETNDLHHARDAYLNIVVGNVYDERFKSLYMDKKRGKPISVNAEKRLFTYSIPGAWDNEKSLAIVKKFMSRPSMCVTQYSYVGKGAFYNETVYPVTDGSIGAPRKESTPLAASDKYGGYKSLNTAYFAVVESDGKKGARIKTIEAVPVLESYRIRDDEDKLREYFASAGLTNPKIIVPKLRKYSLIRYNGTPVLITGITGKQITIYNFIQWFTDTKTDAYVKALHKCSDEIKKGLPDDMDEYEVNKSRTKSGIKINAETNMLLYDEIIAQLERPVYSGLSGAMNFLKNIREKREVFSVLPVSRQIKTLIEMVKFINGRSGLSDMTELGLTANSGKLLFGQNISAVKLEVINQSPCGLHTTIRKV